MAKCTCKLEQLDLVAYIEEQTRPKEVYRVACRVETLSNGLTRVINYTHLPLENRPLREV